MIRLYGITQSRAYRVRWMLEELGQPYEQVPTNPQAGETRTAEFLKLNPNGHVPVLVDGTTVLWESLAINLYLARRYGAGTLWPATVEDEGRTYQWSFWAVTEVEAHALAVLLHRRLLPEADRDAALAATHEQQLARPLGVLDGALRGREYLLGPAFSAADLNVASVLSWVSLSRMDLGSWPAMAAWLRRCLDRDAARAARAA